MPGRRQDKRPPFKEKGGVLVEAVPETVGFEGVRRPLKTVRMLPNWGLLFETSREKGGRLKSKALLSDRLARVRSLKLCDINVDINVYKNVCV
ncbi:hypothetical protein BACI349Y_630012 [Bacillus sp. 349Y]|nr:hypothetical protein BACI349Y_630012 [Bacillus sp. 349Y]